MTDPMPAVVRLRAGNRLLVSRAAVPVSSPPAERVPQPVHASPDPETLQDQIGPRLLVALIEASPGAAEELFEPLLAALEGGGRRCGVIALDGRNRLGARLGSPALAPAWCWARAVPELLAQSGSRVLVPGPDDEGSLSSAQVDGVLERVAAVSESVLVDLGCRWAPRLFRPVLNRATHIWLVGRAGQWTGLEARLEQAEFSGWTDLRRVRSLVIGLGDSPHPPGLSVTPVPSGGNVSGLVRSLLG